MEHLTMLSIIIPSYKEPYLLDTIRNLLTSAKGSIEILVNVDDGDEVIFPEQDQRVKFFYPGNPIGMRAGINLGLSKSRGDYIMKCDAHCAFAPGFDTEIINTMAENHLVIPRRYSLYAKGWQKDDHRTPKDYHYIHFGESLFPLEWKERALERKHHNYDDTMTMQGSCYIAHKNFFLKKVGFLDDRPETYSQFGAEQIEVGLKYWLGGGEIKVNKKTWYAHLFKSSRFYHETGSSHLQKHKHYLKKNGGWSFAARHWLANKEPGMLHPFSWLVEKFWPVPSWPDDRSLWQIK